MGRQNRETENEELVRVRLQPAGAPMGLSGRVSLGAVHRAEGAQRKGTVTRGEGRSQSGPPEMSEHMLGGRTLWEAKQSYIEHAGRKLTKGLQENKSTFCGIFIGSTGKLIWKLLV